MDNIKDNGDKASELFPPSIKGKDLFSDGESKREFTANGTKYYVMEFDKCMTIARLHAYTMLSKSFATGTTAQEDFQYFVQLRDLLADSFASGIGKNIATIMSQLESRIDSYKKNLVTGYPYALYLCTLMICRSDEDLSTWDFDKALDKINDWSKEGFSCLPFLRLAEMYTPDLLAIKKSLADGLTLKDLQVMLGILE